MHDLAIASPALYHTAIIVLKIKLPLSPGLVVWGLEQVANFASFDRCPCMF